MNGTTKRLLRVGGILSIVLSVLIFVMAVIYIIEGTPYATSFLVDGLKSGTIKTSINGTPEEVAAIIQAAFLVTGISMAVVSAVYVANAIIAFKAIKKPSKAKAIANIVFGFLTCTIFNAIGGIKMLSLLSENK